MSEVIELALTKNKVKKPLDLSVKIAPIVN
jgi:ATP-dependent Lon protease